MKMAKIVINEKDYYTDDFNEDQMKMYQEIGLAREEMSRMNYLMQVLDSRCNMLGGMIVEAAEQNDIEQLPDQATDGD
jgi:hypothetical protein